MPMGSLDRSCNWRCREGSLCMLVGNGLLYFLAACGDQPAIPGSLANVKDSAGVRIIEHASLPVSPPTWSVSPVPDVTIGSVDGEGPDAFGRIVWLTVRPDGVIIVADALNHEIRAFNSSGEHVWSAGGAGSGPGDLFGLSSVHALPGDSVVALARGRTASVFDPNGKFVRQYRLDPPPETFPAGPSIVGTMPGGGLSGYAVRMPASMQSGYYRSSLILLEYGADGALTDVGEELPHREGVLAFLEGGMYASTALPLGRDTQLTTSGGTRAVTTQEAFEIRRYDQRATLREIIRVEVPLSALDAQARRRLQAYCLNATEDVATCAGTRHREFEGVLGDVLPALGSIRFDSQRLLWIEEYLPPYAEESESVWWVIGLNGEIAAQASVPRGLTVHHIGVDHVVALIQDEFGLSFLQIHRLTRDPSPLNLTAP